MMTLLSLHAKFFNHMAEYFSNPAYIIHIDFLMGGVIWAASARKASARTPPYRQIPT